MHEQQHKARWTLQIKKHGKYGNGNSNFDSSETQSRALYRLLECGRSRVQSPVKDRVIPKTLYKWYQ